MEITDEEFELLLDRIPLDEDGNVRYPQFLSKFDLWCVGYAFYFSFMSGIIFNLRGSCSIFRLILLSRCALLGSISWRGNYIKN